MPQVPVDVLSPPSRRPHSTVFPQMPPRTRPSRISSLLMLAVGTKSRACVCTYGLISSDFPRHAATDNPSACLSDRALWEEASPSSHSREYRNTAVEKSLVMVECQWLSDLWELMCMWGYSEGRGACLCMCVCVCGERSGALCVYVCGPCFRKTSSCEEDAPDL